MQANNDKEIAKNIRGKVLSGLRWTALLRVTSQTFSWGVTILVIRFLNPDDYGLKAMAEVFFSLLMMLSSAGIGSAIIQAKELSERHVRQVFGVLLCINTTLFFIQLGVAYPLADYYNEPRVIPIMQVLAMGFLLIPFSIIPSSLLSREMEFKRRSIVGLISSTLGGAITLGLAIAGHGVWSLVIGQLSSMVILAVGLTIIKPWLRFPIFSLSGAWNMINFGGVVTLTGLIWFAYTRADVFIAGRALGSELVGIYAVALHLASLPMDKVMPLLHQVAFPAYSRIQEKSDEIIWYFLKSVRLSSIVMFPLFFGLAATADYFVPLILGDKWRDAILPLILLSLIVPLRAVGSLFMPLINAMGRPGVQLGNALISLVIIIPSLLVGVNWGLLGLSVAWVIAFPVVFLISASRSLAVVNIPLMRFLCEMRSALVATLSMLVVLMLLKYILLESINTWLSLGLMVVAGAVAYLGTIWVIDRRSILEFKDLVGMDRPK